MIEVEKTSFKTAEVPTQAPFDDIDEEYYMDDGWKESLNGKVKGWSLYLKDQRNYGNCLPLLFYSGEPLIILGPDCKRD